MLTLKPSGKWEALASGILNISFITETLNSIPDKETLKIAFWVNIFVAFTMSNLAYMHKKAIIFSGSPTIDFKAFTSLPTGKLQKMEPKSIENNVNTCVNYVIT